MSCQSMLGAHVFADTIRVRSMAGFAPILPSSRLTNAVVRGYRDEQMRSPGHERVGVDAGDFIASFSVREMFGCADQGRPRAGGAVSASVVALPPVSAAPPAFAGAT